MNTKRYERLTVHHNSDFSGNAHICLLDRSGEGPPEKIDELEDAPGKDFLRAVPELARVEDWSDFVVESGDLTFRSEQGLVQIIYDGNVIEPTVEELRHVVAHIVHYRMIEYVEDALKDLDRTFDFVALLPDEYFGL